MSGYAAETAQLNIAGKNVTDAATVVGRLSPGDRVDDVASALVGSESAMASGELRTAWYDRFRKWHNDAATLGEALGTAADNYDAADFQAYLEYRRRVRGLI